MTFTLQDWHNRYVQQANWTSEVRSYLLGKLDLSPTERILEVGCGTGVITDELAQQTKSITHGLDNDLPRLIFAKKQVPSSQYLSSVENPGPRSRYLCADGLHLPFPENIFSLICCHYFLLWVKDQRAAISEMVRITKNEGHILLFAEPDHDARIDYPEVFIPYGKMQTTALVKQGIDPTTGRKIGELMHAAGLQEIETGQLQWQQKKMDRAFAQAECDVAAEDMREQLSSEQIEKYREQEIKSWEDSSRVRIIPTFYTMGLVKK